MGVRGRKELDLRFGYSVESRERVMGWRESEAAGPRRIGVNKLFTYEFHMFTLMIYE